MSRRSLLVAMVSLALAACVAPTPGLPTTSAPAELTVTVTPAQGGEPEPLGTGGGSPDPGSPSLAEAVPGEFIVGLSSDANAEQLAQAVGASLESEIRFSGRYAHLALPAGLSDEEATARLVAQAGVTSVMPNWRARPSYLSSDQTPNDPRFREQWAHEVSAILPAWRALGSAFTAANVAIAVLDTGVDAGHPEFGDRVLPGRNFTPEHPDTSCALEDDVTDVYGHGTHVAGIAAAAGHNAQGMAGVAWDAKILPVKVLALNGGTAAGILQGLRYAVDYEGSGATVRVINLSLGFKGRFTTEAAFEDAMAYAWRRGILVVSAAGNESGEVTRPGINPHGLVVSATSVYMPMPGVTVEFFASFSNRGDRIDLAAPGSDILSAVPRNSNLISDRHGLVTRAVGDHTTPIDPPYAYDNGTSMAAPYVSGLAALMVARYDPYHLKANATFLDRMVDRLESSADDLGPPGQDPYFGHGRVNAQKALAPSSL